MHARPAWLALGVIVAAGTASYEPLGGDSAVAVIAAVAVSLALAVAAFFCLARGRHGLAGSLATASLGAALVAARLSVGLVAGSGAGPPQTTALPDGTGPWTAGVESAHTINGLQIATVDLAGAPLRCAAQFPAYPRLIAGDVVTWSGQVRPLADSDYDRYLAAQGISASCQASGLALVRHDDSVAGRLEAIRQVSGDALQKVLPEPEGGLAAAILIGLRDRVDRNLAAAFTTAGVSHIVAISGWNIAIVAATVAALLRGLGRRRRAMVTICAIIGYTLFAGASPSVVRAAFMSGVALMAVESGRGSRVAVSLAWAVSIMLLLAPGTVSDVGFQLSAAATAGLIAWATPLTGLIGERFPRLPGVLRDTLGVSLAAQIATLPIALLTFGRLSLIAPAANLVAVPLVPPAMAAGALAFAAGWIAVAGAPIWLTGLLAMPAQLVLVALVAVVQLAASVPGANETLPFPANVAAAAAASLLLVRLHRALRRSASVQARRQKSAAGATRSAGTRACPSRLRTGQRWALAGAGLAIVMAGSVVAARADGSVHVIVLDVGQGDSILLEGDRGGRILVDGGPDANGLMTALDRYVPAWDRRLDAIVLTHPHDDHVAGLVAVVERYRVGRAFESGWPAATPDYRAWKAALSAHGLRAEQLRAGQTLRLDDATLEVLWPDDGTTRPDGLDPNAADNRKTNDASIVLLGEYEGRRFLLTGDIENDVDPVLLGRGLPAVDMLKVAHHGSATASSDDLLAAVDPSVAVVSVGADNRYGHPNAGTMARLRVHSPTVRRTDQDGTVETTLDRVAVTVTWSRGAGGGATQPTVSQPTVSQPTVSQVAAAGPSGLLYDSSDVRTQPSRQRGPSSLTAAACVAPPPLAGGCGDGSLAGVAGRFGRTAARSPPGGISRAPP